MIQKEPYLSSIWRHPQFFKKNSYWLTQAWKGKEIRIVRTYTVHISELTFEEWLTESKYRFGNTLPNGEPRDHRAYYQKLRYDKELGFVWFQCTKNTIPKVVFRVFRRRRKLNAKHV